MVIIWFYIKMSVKFYGNPRGSVVPERFASPRISLTSELGVVSDGFHHHDEDDRHWGPDCYADHNGNSLLFVRMLQILIVTKETPDRQDNYWLFSKETFSPPLVGTVLLRKDIDVGHGQDQHHEAKYLYHCLAHHLSTAGRRGLHVQPPLHKLWFLILVQSRRSLSVICVCWFTDTQHRIFRISYRSGHQTGRCCL